MLTRNAPQKPSRLDRAVSKWEQRTARAKAKGAAQRAKGAAWAKVSAAVRARDGGRCRICQVPTVRAGSGDPRRAGHGHHIRFRSAGRSNEMSNVIHVCGECHEAIHRHVIMIAGTAEQLQIERPS